MARDGMAARAERARVNGAKSRGPTSAGGKARSARNARRHGLYAERVAPVDPVEAAYREELRQELVAEHRPCGLLEHRLLARLAAVLVEIERAEGMAQQIERMVAVRPFANLNAPMALPPLLQDLPAFNALERHRARLMGELLRLEARIAKWGERPALAEEADEEAAPEPEPANDSAPPPAEPSANSGTNPERSSDIKAPPRPAARHPLTDPELMAMLDGMERLIRQGRLDEAKVLHAKLRNHPAWKIALPR